MKKGDLQHAWVQLMLRQRGIVVHGDPLLDHGRLMHHLIYGTHDAPSGAMMDEDYTTILNSVGGADEGNMVQQMQSIVCSQVNPERHSAFPVGTCWDGTCDAENTVYDSMVLTTQHGEFDDTEHTDTDDHDTDTVLKQKLPTAPEWDENADSNFEHDGERLNAVDGPIQCTITAPTHTTPTAVTALAVVGGTTLVVAIGMAIALYWLSLQGVKVTGFWLTLTPGERGPRNDENALL